MHGIKKKWQNKNFEDLTLTILETKLYKCIYKGYLLNCAMRKLDVLVWALPCAVMNNM